MKSSAEEITREVTERLRPPGLDLVRAFDITRYNELVAGHDGLVALPQFGRRGALALLIGNSKALWPRFTSAFQASAELRESGDPLDSWIVSVLEECVAHIPAQSTLGFSHEPGDGLVSMLHLAEASGLAHVGPAHLAVHPEHGTWIGLRAVMIFDAEPPAAQLAPAPDPCTECDAPCVAALGAALESAPDSRLASSRDAWVAIRDACPVGRASRYSEAQLKYHYTKDLTALV